MLLKLKKLIEEARRVSGPGLVEYALILVLVALVVLAAIQTVGKTVRMP